LQSAAVPRYVGDVVIVHVLSSFGVGGQERVALDLAAGQVERGHQVHVVSLAPPPDGPLAAEFTAAGVATITIPKRGGLDVTLIPRLARAFRRLRADVVHSHNPLPLIYGAPAARLIGARAIHTKHGKNPGSRAHMMLRRAAAQAAHWFVAVSETTAAQAREQHDAPDNRIIVIPNGIRLERFRRDPETRSVIRREIGIPDDAWVIGTVGRIDQNKNQPLLVRAAAPTLGPRNHLILVGDGPDRAVLEAAVAATGPAAKFIHVLGRRMDVDRIFSAFDVFALSSSSEGLPLVIPESMASELPIIATSVGGLPDIIQEGQTGLLCPVDEAALRSCLESLRKDPSKARGMGAAARVRALSHFSHTRMLDDYLRLYVRGLTQLRV
jgi:glycosyltransferase involved in cell wall biosynthesis